MEEDLSDPILFATSGTTSLPKFVVHTRATLRASAAAVNAHLAATAADVWLLALPTRHVGGYGIGVRAELSGSRVITPGGRWNPADFTAAAAGATLSALVPTQVYDLVVSGLAAPPSLRAVVVGGGALAAETEAAARALGWPLLLSYGCSEAGSQVATQPLPAGSERRMRVLAHLEARTDADGRLALRGSSLFLGYRVGETVHDPKHGGWFTTDDHATVTDRWIGGAVHRADRRVKILGELVDLDAIEKQFGEGTCAVVAEPDPRAGMRVVLVGEGSEQDWAEKITRYNRSAAGVERVAALRVVASLPRSHLGKIERHKLVGRKEQ